MTTQKIRVNPRQSASIRVQFSLLARAAVIGSRRRRSYSARLAQPVAADLAVERAAVDPEALRGLDLVPVEALEPLGDRALLEVLERAVELLGGRVLGGLAGAGGRARGPRRRRESLIGGRERDRTVRLERERLED